jgi:RNA polymerase-binding protein DksA
MRRSSEAVRPRSSATRKGPTMPGAPSKKSTSRGAKTAGRASVAAKKPVKAAARKPATVAKAVPKKAAAAKKPVAVAPKKAAKVVKQAAAPVKKAVKKVVTATVAKAEPPVKAVPKKKTVTCELSGFEVMPSSPALSAKTLDRLKAKLVEEKQRLLHQADELTAEAEELAREREAGDTQFDEESGEGDTVNVERERDLLLSATARQVVEEIDEALARIKKGTYGVCKYAGRKLPVDRLEAIPWANVCVDCKARAERRR